ncbi:response regulator [Bradyrhizobium sp. AUGA SZCCT0283]|nr:response regulator [Bradyrhizobium sp. AUGA SZCCT0283]
MRTPKSILVVDDDSSMRKCMKRLLNEHGFNVALFDSGVALLRRADFGSAFCVIIDINLHDQSGIDLRRQLADRGVRLPVIFITGNDSDSNRSAAVEAGCIGYLSKPFAARSLIEAVEAALAEVF